MPPPTDVESLLEAAASWARACEPSGDASGYFAVKQGHIFFESNQPGSYATLFGPHGEFLFNGDASRFDDGSHTYAWAFQIGDLPLRLNDQIVFATADRAVVGEVDAVGDLRVAPRRVFVERNADGKPIRLVSDNTRQSLRSGVDTPLVSIVGVHRITRPPKVSVVTCSYNRAEYLRIAIESLLAQTDPDWEHLIYDDASSKDSGVEQVLTWAERDPRVRVWRGEHNIDLPAARWNFLRDRAAGRYHTILDDDNEKLPRFVEVMAGKLDADPSLDFVTCGFLIRTTDRGNVPYYLNMSTDRQTTLLMSTCDGGAVLYRREALERVGYFAEDLRTNEDWDLLRRGTQILDKWHNIPGECYATYRQHASNRMLRANDLGNNRDVARVRRRPVIRDLSVGVVQPDFGRLTASQRDVINSVKDALAAIPWVKPPDLPGEKVALVVSPFQLSDSEIADGARGYRTVVSLHMEDPYALSANANRVRRMVENHPEVWVCTNDASTVSVYRELVGDRIIVCPLLGVDTDIAQGITPGDRDIDVLLVGYAYPSRKRFMEKLLPQLGGLRVMLCGDGWENWPAETCPTQGLRESYALFARARAVVCLHRVHGDCSDGPVEPLTLNRAFMEGYFGGRVFVDRSRPRHAIDDGDVVFYDGPDDLAQTLRERALITPGRAVLGDQQRADRFAERCRAIYTYRARLARVLNCVRAPRFLAEIP